MLTHFHKFPADNYVLVEEDQEVMNIFWFSIICYAFKYLCSLLKLLPQPCTVLPPFCGLRNRGFEKFDCLPNISQLVKWRKWNLLCPGPFDSLDCAFFDSCHFYILAGVLQFSSLYLLCSSLLPTSTTTTLPPDHFHFRLGLWDKPHNWSQILFF